MDEKAVASARPAAPGQRMRLDLHPAVSDSAAQRVGRAQRPTDDVRLACGVRMRAREDADTGASVEASQRRRGQRNVTKGGWVQSPSHPVARLARYVHGEEFWRDSEGVPRGGQGACPPVVMFLSPLGPPRTEGGRSFLNTIANVSPNKGDWQCLWGGAVTAAGRAGTISHWLLCVPGQEEALRERAASRFPPAQDNKCVYYVR